VESYPNLALPQKVFLFLNFEIWFSLPYYDSDEQDREKNGGRDYILFISTSHGM
jgi:hypothetical protein